MRECRDESCTRYARAYGARGDHGRRAGGRVREPGRGELVVRGEHRVPGYAELCGQCPGGRQRVTGVELADPQQRDHRVRDAVPQRGSGRGQLERQRDDTGSSGHSTRMLAC
jgi:hypothetical protein